MPRGSARRPRTDITALISYRILLLSNTLARWAAREYPRRFGMTLPEWRILSAVSARGTVSPIAVSEILSIDKAWVSRTVPRLVRRGYLHSTRDPADRRRSILALTAKGASMCARLSRASLRRQERLLEVLTPDEIAGFRRLLARLQLQAEEMLARQQK